MDPLSFPVLAGAALSQAFGFLFGRLAHLLDSRGEKQDAEEAVETPEVLVGDLGKLTARNDVIEAHLADIEELVGRLSVYERKPERLNGNDITLRDSLAHARALLEQVYGQHITFRGEERPASGVHVEQTLETVAGRLTGVKAGRVRQARVRQEVTDVSESGSVVGIDADDVG